MKMILSNQMAMESILPSRNCILCFCSHGSAYLNFRTLDWEFYLHSLLFLQHLSTLLGLKCFSEFLRQLPQNTHQAKKYVGHSRDCFTKYVSCPKCHSIYDMDICSTRLSNGTLQSRKFVHLLSTLIILKQLSETDIVMPYL